MTNAERARLGYAALARGDLDAVCEFLAPDVKWHAGNPSASGACENRDQVLRFMSAPRIRRRIGELVDVIEAGDKVVVIMRPSAETGSEAGLVANLTTFRAGRAIEMVHYPNPDDALTAVGVVG